MADQLRVQFTCVRCVRTDWSDGYEAITAEQNSAVAVCVCGQFRTEHTRVKFEAELTASVCIIWQDTSPVSACRQAVRDPTQFTWAAA